MPGAPATVSVVVPARQAAHTLPDCLSAILASTPSPLEIVVVVDGPCTDGTAKVAEAHGARVLQLPERLGPAGARNAGVAAAAGAILVFIDADVAVRPDAIRLLVASFEEPGVDAVFGSYDREPSRLTVASQYKNLLHHFVHQGGREAAHTFWSGLGAVRRDAFERIGGFDSARYRRPSIEDIDLGHRLREAGSEIRLVKLAQGSHLKLWTAFGIFKTDLFDRALPWTELILRAGRMPTDLNLALRHRIGVAATAVLIASLFGTAVNPGFIYLAAAALLVAVVAGGDVFRFFVRERGLLFAVLSVPLHLSYYAASGLGFGMGLFRHAAGPMPARGILETRRIFTNASVLAAGEVAARGFSFLATVHVARVLGASGFGRIELASALALYVGVLSTFGLDLVGTMRVAVDPDRARTLARTVASLRVALCAVMTAVLLALTWLVPRFAGIRILLLLTTIPIFAESLSLAWLFQGLERMKRIAAVGILGQAVYAAGVFALVRRPEDILRVPVVSGLGAAVAAAALGIVGWRVLRRLPAERAPGLTRELLVEAAPLAAITAAGIVNYNADVIIMGMLGDERHVGLYRAAGRISGVFQMLGAGFSTAVFPSLARESRVKENLRSALDWAVRTSAMGWIVAAALLIAAAPLILRWTFGPSYFEATRTLRLLFLAAAVVGVRAQYRSALVVLRETRRNLAPTLWAAAASIVLNLLLIPRIGLLGMALATIFSETLMLVLIRREVGLALRSVPS
ncbi:MAG: glycosyltransferase [Acidobacteriota bacterium]